RRARGLPRARHPASGARAAVQHVPRHLAPGQGAPRGRGMTDAVDLPRIRHLIGGKLVDPVDGGWMEDIEPATGQAWAWVPDGTAADVDRAVSAAQAAFPGWSRTPP